MTPAPRKKHAGEPSHNRRSCSSSCGGGRGRLLPGGPPRREALIGGEAGSCGAQGLAEPRQARRRPAQVPLHQARRTFVMGKLAASVAGLAAGGVLAEEEDAGVEAHPLGARKQMGTGGRRPWPRCSSWRRPASSTWPRCSSWRRPCLLDAPLRLCPRGCRVEARCWNDSTDGRACCCRRRALSVGTRSFSGEADFSLYFI